MMWVQPAGEVFNRNATTTNRVARLEGNLARDVTPPKWNNQRASVSYRVVSEGACQEHPCKG